MVEIPISIAAQISTYKNMTCKHFKIILPKNNFLVTESKDTAADDKVPDRFKGMVVKKLSGRAWMWVSGHRADLGIQGHPQRQVQSHLELYETLYPNKRGKTLNDK